MKSGWPTFLDRSSRIVRLAEDVILGSLLLAMILLAGLQIFLRNILDTGLIWGDELLRIQVLWLGLIGAMAASRNNNHVKIDLLSKFLPPRSRLFVQLVLHGFTAVICALVAWHGGRFVLMEREFGATVLGNYPAWVFESVIPGAFVLIAWRYLLNFFGLLRQLISGSAP